MTSETTLNRYARVLGVRLESMLLETDMQARFLIPMSVSLSFGILFATLITLVLIPCIYLMLEDAKNWIFTSEKLAEWERRDREEMEDRAT